MDKVYIVSWTDEEGYQQFILFDNRPAANQCFDRLVKLRDEYDQDEEYQRLEVTWHGVMSEDSENLV